MKNIFRGIVFLGALALCFAFGFSYRDIRSGRPIASAYSRILSGRASADASPERVFKDAYTNVIANFYKPVTPKNLTYAGMAGMMGSLGDPHTLFFPPTAAAAFDTETKGQFVGIGAKLDTDPLGAKVMKVFTDGPAYASGLKAGDIITVVDGKSVAGMEVTLIVTRIRGQEGTNVKLGILKPKQDKPVTLTIKRRKVNTPTVDDTFLDDEKIGVMSISQFAEPTTLQFDAALDRLDEKKPEGLIIDLRDNPGGLLETDVEMLSRFVEDKVVVRIKSREGFEETQKTLSGLKRKFPYPIAILVNEDTASAAEIFTGVLHDYKLASIVGTHSYGKASVQNVWPLADGSSAKITIGRYFLPISPDIGRKVDEDGVYISGGLEPDVKVDLDPDDSSIKIGDPKTDTQLRKAIELVKSKR